MQGNSVVKRAKNGCHSNSFIMIFLSGRCTPGICFYILFIMAFCALSQQNIKAVRCCCSWALAKGVARLLWELYLNWEAFQNEHCFKWNSLQEVKCPKVASKGTSECWGDYCHSPRHRKLKRLNQKLQEFIVRTLGCCQENWAIFPFLNFFQFHCWNLMD